MFETERLFIRHFEIGDAASCLEGWGTDSSLGNYILGYPMEKAQMESFVKAMAENKHAWVIVEKESQKCIGYITIDIPYAQLGIGEIGYAVGAEYQQKGYAFEALNCMIQAYLAAKNMYMLEAKYQVNNKASANLLCKLGFQIDGELRDRRIDVETGQRVNLVICSITKKEIFCNCFTKN